MPIVASDSRYSPSLKAALTQAEGFLALLSMLEHRRALPDSEAARAWVAGRKEEVEAVVRCIIADWRSGARAEDAAAEAVDSYLRSLRVGAGRHLALRASLECVAGDVAQTVPLDAYATLRPSPRTGGSSDASIERIHSPAEPQRLLESTLRMLDVRAQAELRSHGFDAPPMPPIQPQRIVVLAASEAAPRSDTAEKASEGAIAPDNRALVPDDSSLGSEGPYDTCPDVSSTARQQGRVMRPVQRRALLAMAFAAPLLILLVVAAVHGALAQRAPHTWRNSSTPAVARAGVHQ